MIEVTGGDVAGEAGGIGDAAPGFQADEGAAWFGGSPEAISLGGVAAHGEDFLLVLVQQGYGGYLLDRY